MSEAMNPAVAPDRPGAILIDVKEGAHRLGLSERTVWRLNSTGRMPMPLTIGGKSKRWMAEEIGAWVAAGCPARKGWEAMSKGSAA
ncbi:MAG TPA: AlpA family phage regulatory protein [Isosphaeraceae bacterium]|jgi:predicted DNA-binding transcriptional regulator AlpA|nr:AlpA family phage regulatory protein [Isosphaeraceae bacterium]